MIKEKAEDKTKPISQREGEDLDVNIRSSASKSRRKRKSFWEKLLGD